MAILYLSVDCGGSQTKIIYQLSGREHPEYLLMSPLVEEIKPEKIATYLDRKSSLGSPAPEREAYLTWLSRVFVVGDLAQEFDPEDRTSEQKYENALYKVAAAIGVIVNKTKLKLGKKKLELNLGVLIPWDEYNDREIFEKRLRIILTSFEFREQVISCQIGNILIRPEGGGIAATHIRQKGNDWLHKHKIAVLMFGHRNVSSLYFEYGKLIGDSPLLGFVNLLDGVIERKSGLERDRLATAIMDTVAEAYYVTHKDTANENYYPYWDKYQPIQNLAKAKDEQLRLEECTRIAEAIDTAHDEYWEKVSKWLAKTLPSDLDVVIFSGGTSRFLQPELERYFNVEYEMARSYPGLPKRTGKYKKVDPKLPMPSLVWNVNLSTIIHDKFGIDKGRDTHNISIRLTDCYGLFDYLIAAVEQGHARK